MFFVGKARNAIVGLRLEIGARNASLSHGRKVGQAAARNQIAYKRGNEHGLAGASQARHSKAHCRRYQIGKAGARATERARCWVVDI
jgi:hypothetical protein